MSGMIEYRASADAFVLWVSILVGLVLLGIAAGGIRTGMVAGTGVLRAVGYVVGLACLGLLVLSYLYSPRGFRVSDTAVIVERPGKDVEIEIGSVESVEPTRISLTGAARTFGNGGLFGVYGSFRNDEFGSFKIYGSRFGDAVLLRTKQGPLVLTPDDGEGFAEDVRARVAAAH